MSHPTPTPDERELARFGLTLAVICVLPAAWRLLGAGSFGALALLAAGMALAGLAALRPALLTRFHGFMARLGAVLGRVNTVVLLTLAFSLVLVPMALLMRFAGRDPLDRKLRDRDSYWHRREPVPDPKGSMEHIF
jgi:hypothetical protein